MTYLINRTRFFCLFTFQPCDINLNLQKILLTWKRYFVTLLREQAIQNAQICAVYFQLNAVY